MAVIKVLCKNLKDNPHCPHGPTLKFVRIHNGCKLEFFACSTYRDRKDCGFYLAAGEKSTERVHQVWTLEKEKVLPSVDHAAVIARLQEIRQVSPKDRLYCHSCCQLDLVSRREQHRSHDVQTSVPDSSLTRPSQILKPKEGSKKEAQYFFSAATTQVIVDNLRSAGVSRVLCLGTPRVHEHIQSSKGEMQSLLLDLDHRYHSFWPPDKFIWFNMFNRHMLSVSQGVSKHALRRFLASGGLVALVMDPPFGGHLDPLAATVEYFTRLVAKRDPNNRLFVIWIFPYFRERQIVQKCPSLSMLDYKVMYINHKQFNNGSKGRKLGSPVRLFTNMDLSEFVLPQREGYHFCGVCVKWVAEENKHCNKCNVCPSKNGRTYIHCDSCGCCVKPQWQHCDRCQTCLPQEHQCHSKVVQSLNEEYSEPRHKKMKKETKPKNYKKKCKSKK